MGESHPLAACGVATLCCSHLRCWHRNHLRLGLDALRGAHSSLLAHGHLRWGPRLEKVSLGCFLLVHACCIDRWYIQTQWVARMHPHMPHHPPLHPCLFIICACSRPLTQRNPQPRGSFTAKYGTHPCTVRTRSAPVACPKQVPVHPFIRRLSAQGADGWDATGWAQVREAASPPPTRSNPRYGMLCFETPSGAA